MVIMATYDVVFKINKDMIIDKIQDGEKHYDDPLGIGIVIYPENINEIAVIKKILNHPDYLRQVLNNQDDS
jgi:hypothetical protein